MNEELRKTAGLQDCETAGLNKMKNEKWRINNYFKRKNYSLFIINYKFKHAAAFTLAEGATHVETCNNNRKAAFTLAEVLITLGIIGVVAAMTIPSLIANYQKKTYVEGLKVGISMLEQGFKKVLADEGVESLNDTELVKVCNETVNDNMQLYKEKCYNLLEKYFKGIKAESVDEMQALGDDTNIIEDSAKCKQLVGKTNKWYYLNDKTKCRGWKNMSVVFANGMKADVYIGDSGYYNGTISLDINGSKGPNTWGRDAFYLRLMPDGRILPQGGFNYLKAYADYNNSNYEEIVQSYHWKEIDACSNTSVADGSKCAARIIENGWVMDY